MRCHQCGTETEGTETSPGTVSAICPPCNVALTGDGHHPDAYDHDAKGNPIRAQPTAKPTTTRSKVDKKAKATA